MVLTVGEGGEARGRGSVVEEGEMVRHARVEGHLEGGALFAGEGVEGATTAAIELDKRAISPWIEAWYTTASSSLA